MENNLEHVLQSQANIKSICVFCGSSSGKSPKYMNDAELLGRLLAERGIKLVYGGGSIGIMGKLAKSVQSSGGKVLGIIPHALREVSGDVVGECVVVDTMHDRKALMSEKAEAFVALPGGFGTMEELVETITWSQLRIHSKPVGILNINGYFDMFIKWMDNALAEGFIDAKSRNIVVVRDNPKDLLDALVNYVDPISDSTWILSNDMWKKRGMRLKDV